MSLSSHFSSFFFSFKIFWNDNWWWFYKQKNWKFPLIVWKEEFYVNFWRHQVKKISMGSLLMHPALLNVFVTNIIQVSVYFSLSSICIEKALLQNIDQELEIQQSKTLAKKKIIIKERAVNTGWYFFSKITKVTKRVNFLIWVFPLLGWLPRGGFRFASNEGPYWFSNSTWFTANDRVNKRAKQGYPCFGPCWRYLSRIRW